MSDKVTPSRSASVRSRRPPSNQNAPPVPARKQSLTPGEETEDIKSQIIASSFMVQKRNMAGNMSIDSVQEEPNVTYTFEAKSQYKDSFRQLYEFYQRNILCDVELKVGTKIFKCHRVVLACTSRYFKTMFTSEMAESRQPVITMQDVTEKALELLINFAYTAKITLTIDNVQSLLFASSILQIEIVANACCDFMKTHLHPSNCIGIRTFAEQHGRQELVKMADSYTQDHFSGVVNCEEFTSMTVKHLEALVSSESLNVKSETDVYEAVIKWVRHDVPNRKQHLSNLISKIKLALLPAAYLMDKVATEELIRTNLECRDYLDEAKFYQLSQAQHLPGIKVSARMRPRKSYAGVIFCVGGRGTSGDPFKTIECYDWRRDRWFQVSEMSTRRRHVGVVAISDKLYAIGGHDGTDHLSSGEVFDPSTNKWSPIASMQTLRRGIALACLGGPIYAVGGLDDSTCFDIVERYDPESDTWSFVSSMNKHRGGVAVATVKGYLYAVGGNDGATSLDSCERYDPHLNKWSMVAPMKKKRAGAGVAELNGFLYVVGGFDDNLPLDSVERYDVGTNTWTTVASMSCKRGGVGVAALGGRIYSVGGHDGTCYLNSVEAYDPVINSWSPVKQTQHCRAGAGLAYAPTSVYKLRRLATNASSSV